MFAGLLVAVAAVQAEGEIWEEDDREVLIRSERGTKNNKGTFNCLWQYFFITFPTHSK